MGINFTMVNDKVKIKYLTGEKQTMFNILLPGEWINSVDIPMER
jgi:hypothetical protein